MKTFEIEFEDLKNWLFERTDIYFEKIKKAKIKGHDSATDYGRSQDIKEYNRRLTELKEKYNRN